MNKHTPFNLGDIFVKYMIVKRAIVDSSEALARQYILDMTLKLQVLYKWWKDF